MKKWLSVFLFLSLSGCHNAFAWRNMVFYSLSSNARDTIPDMTILDTREFTVPWQAGTGTVTYRDCQTSMYVGTPHYHEYLAWMIINKTAKTTDGRYIITLDASTGSSGQFSREHSGDQNKFFFVNGYKWDVNVSSGNVCADTGHTFGIHDVFTGPRLSFKLPATLPKGRYELEVKYAMGIEYNYYNTYQERNKIPYAQAKALPETGTLILAVNNTGTCTPSAQALEIAHGSLAIDKAAGHFASKAFSITCDVPTKLKLKLINNGRSPEYSRQNFSVGLGNGWDSIIYLNNLEQGEMELNFPVAGSHQTVTIGSKLYGEKNKIKGGKLEGAMTMEISLP